MPDATRVWPVGTRRQLLFDRRFVESSSGLQFTLNPPLGRRPVNLPRPSGLHHVSQLTVLDVDGRCWMYYHMRPATPPSGISEKMCCLAYSDDGIDWEPAPVDRFVVAGSARNNVVMPGVVSTPFLDPKETAGCRFWSAGSMCERTEQPIWDEARGTYFGGYDAEDGRRVHFIYQYYTKGPGTHHANDLDVHIWQAKQRLDGFVSVDAGSDDGWLVTPPIAFEGSRLQLNIDCGAMGEAWVELQDEAGKPLPGYAFEDAVSVDRNGVAQEVWWQTGPDVGSLSGRPVRLKLRMRSAKLYAFQFVKAG